MFRKTEDNEFSPYYQNNPAEPDGRFLVQFMQRIPAAKVLSADRAEEFSRLAQEM